MELLGHTGSVGEESACNAGDLGLIPGLGRSPGEGKGYPLQYPGLENSMDCIVHGVTKNWARFLSSIGESQREIHMRTSQVIYRRNHGTFIRHRDSLFLSIVRKAEGKEKKEKNLWKQA